MASNRPELNVYKTYAMYTNAVATRTAAIAFYCL